MLENSTTRHYSYTVNYLFLWSAPPIVVFLVGPAGSIEHFDWHVSLGKRL